MQADDVDVIEPADDVDGSEPLIRHVRDKL